MLSFRTTNERKNKVVLSNSGSSWLVDDTENVQTSNSTGIFGGLTLGVVEVGGDSDDGILDIRAKEVFGRGFHLGENHGRDFFGREFLGFTLVFDLNHGLVTFRREESERPVGCIVRESDNRGDGTFISLNDGVIESTSNKTLSVEDSVLRIEVSLILGGSTNEALVVGERHVGGSCAITLIVGNNFDVVGLPDSDATVCSSKINTNSSGHVIYKNKLGMKTCRGVKNGNCKVTS